MGCRPDSRLSLKSVCTLVGVAFAIIASISGCSDGDRTEKLSNALQTDAKISRVEVVATIQKRTAVSVLRTTTMAKKNIERNNYLCIIHHLSRKKKKC